MRPEKAYGQLNKAMSYFHKDRADLGTLAECLDSVNKLIEVQESQLGIDFDFRTVHDVYGCEISKNDVYGELFYISDRWNAPHRLKFIKYVIENAEKYSRK